MLRKLQFTGLILTATIILMTTAKATGTFADSPSLIILKVDADSNAMKAGLKVGDLLLSYNDRPLPSTDALMAAHQNTVGKKEIVLRVRRGEETLTVTLPVGKLGITGSLNLPVLFDLDKEIGSLLPKRKFDEIASKLSLNAKKLQESGQTEAASSVYQRSASAYEQIQKWKEAQESYLAAWVLVERQGDAAAQAVILEGIGRCRNGLGYYREAELWFKEARRVSEAAGNEMWAAVNLTNIGGIAHSRGEFRDAHEYYVQALKILNRLLPDSLQVAIILNRLGNTASSSGCMEEAENYNLKVLKLCELYPDSPLLKAVAFHNLGNISMMMERPSAAEKYYRGAQDIFDKFPVDMSIKASNLTGLGNLAQMQGDLKAAQDYHQKSLTISQQNASINPQSVSIKMDIAGSFNNLGNIAYLLGDLETAKDYYSKALELRQKFSRNPLYVSSSKSALGHIALASGDFQTAESYYREALVIAEQLEKRSPEVAGSLQNLGVVAQIQGDLQAAQYYHNSAWGIKSERGSRLLDVADNATNLGNVAFLSNKFKDAEKHYEEALKIRREHTPGSLKLAGSLCNLGNIKIILGNWQTGQAYNREALTIYEQQAPNSLEMAISLNGLGNASHKSGDMKSARDYHLRALKIQSDLAPDSFDMISTLNNLGLIALEEGHLSDALQYYNQTVDIIETQRQRIFSLDNRAFFIEGHKWEYYGLLRTHIALNNLPAAFATVERARARTLVELISERRLDLPDSTSEFAKRQKEINRNRSAAYYALKNASTNKQPENYIEEQKNKLVLLNIQQRELEAEVRRSESVKFANLEYPQPLDLKGVQDTLDSGTLLLTYFVGYKESYLFAVTKTEFKMFTLKFGEKDIYKKVLEFRGEFSNLRSDLGYPGRLRVTIRKSKQLYDDLIEPAKDMVRDASRILICPDGPLQVLPFAALVSENGASPRYLIDDKPLHTIVSMTVYKQTKQQPKNNQGPVTILAFGNPLYSNEQTAERPKQKTDKSEAEKSNNPSLPPLQGTEKEVREIEKMFGNSATIYLGKDAREAIAKDNIAKYTILHFAVHGLLDDQNGLDSALVLSQPEAIGLLGTDKDNGYLQAWEIFKQPKLNADLVVLSACNAGLGGSIWGEGLIGLTRAFQYAGARSIAISLWNVSDDSAVVLITTFYREIRGGASKDVAMQRAMAAVRSNPKWRHPYYWATFVINGDWQ